MNDTTTRGDIEMAGDLEGLKRQLESCMDDLARMPRWKSGSEWHVDRVNEAQWLVRQIERREAERKYLLKK